MQKRDKEHERKRGRVPVMSSARVEDGVDDEGTAGAVVKEEQEVEEEEDVVRKRVRKVIEQHFDEEIQRRESESSLIAVRLEQVHHLMEQLRDAWVHRGRHTRSARPSEGQMSVTKSMDVVDDDDDHNDSSQRQPLFVRTLDDCFVRLQCPVCARTQFHNVVGFVNHCRIVHHIKFSTSLEAAIHCGQQVQPECVPPDNRVHDDIPLDIEWSRNQRVQSVANEISSTSNDAQSLTSASPTAVERSQHASATTAQDECVISDERDVSRFHVKRRVYVGNTSKWITANDRSGRVGEHGSSERARELSTHKWMCYVRGDEDHVRISSFIESVRFYLHSSYEPNVIEVRKPPFCVHRMGWGEFPLRVQIVFKDASNRPVDVVHHLVLDRTRSGLQSLGSESLITLELNRKWFEDRHLIRVHDTTPLTSELETSTDVFEAHSKSVMESSSSHDGEGVSRVLSECASIHPLYGSQCHLSYPIESDRQSFTSLSLYRRVSREWRRAKAITAFAKDSVVHVKHVNDSQVKSLTTTSVYKWLIKNALTTHTRIPSSAFIRIKRRQLAHLSSHCRVCGLSHDQRRCGAVESFDALQTSLRQLSTDDVVVSKDVQRDRVHVQHVPLNGVLSNDEHISITKWCSSRARVSVDCAQVLSSALQSFVRFITTSSVKEALVEKDRQCESHVIVTPFYLLRSIANEPLLDFLCFLGVHIVTQLRKHHQNEHEQHEHHDQQ